MNPNTSNQNQLHLSDDDELILSFDDQYEYSYNNSQSVPFDGVDMAQSITCSSTHPQHQSQNNSNLLRQCQKESATVNKKTKKPEQAFVTYSQIFQLICENDHLRRENQSLKNKLQQSTLQTSMRKTRTLNNSHKNQFKKDLSKNELEKCQNSIYNSTVEKFNFMQSFSKCQGTIQKVKNLVILQQFCKVKSMEETVKILIQDIDDVFKEFTRHQKAYQKQISNLKKLNQNLSLSLEDTDRELETILVQLNKTPIGKRRQNSSGKNEHRTQTNLKKGFYSPSFSSQVPYFAKTFSHSMEEIQFVSTVQEELAFYRPQQREQIETFVKTIFWVKQRLGKGQANLEINPINLAKSDRLKHYIQEIQKSIEKIQRIEANRQFLLHGDGINRSLQNNLALQQFLKCFSNNIPLFLKKIESSSIKQKNGVLLNVLLSAYISFIEIYFSEWKLCRVNTPIGLEFIGKFWRIMTCLKMRSGVQNSPDVDNYLEEMRNFLDSINEV